MLYQYKPVRSWKRLTTALSLSSAFVVAAPSIATADAPQVVTDIAPIQGLVAMVMGETGEPAVLVPPGTSPHYFSLRPSDARAVSDADLFVTIGPSLAPWLERVEGMTGPDAETIELLEVPGTTLFAYRENVALGEDEHDHGAEGHDDHDDHADHDDHDDHHDEHAEHADEHGDDHDDHDDHADAHDDHDHHDDHADDRGEKDHEEDHASHDGHDDHDDHGDHDEHAHHDHHGEGSDPHAWLAPSNASVWLDAIAGKLSDLDPDQADVYKSNAESAKAEIEGVAAEIKAKFDGIETRGFFVMHDAYQYFEDAFDLQPTAAIADGNAQTPGAARLRDLREAAAEGNAACVFTEPQLNDNVVNTVVEGTDLQVVQIDPLGADAPTGKEHYPSLLRAMAESFEACFK